MDGLKLLINEACLGVARRSITWYCLTRHVGARPGKTRLSKETMNENDEMMQLFPAWREAAKLFLEEEFNANDIIEHAWFFENLGLEQPTEIMPKHQFDTIQLAYMANMEQLKEFLLQEKKICLVSVWGIGYRILPSQEQAEYAEKALHTKLQKNMRKAVSRLVNTSLDQLDVRERQVHADTMARVAGLRVLLRDERRKLPSPGEA